MNNCARDCELPAQLDWRYRGPLKRYFRSRGCIPSSADDLTQDVFLRVIAYHRSNSIRNLDAFLFQTAANLFRDRTRAAQRWHMTSLDDASDTQGNDILLIESITPERVLEARQEVRVVNAAISELDARSRRIFIMNRIDRMKHCDIAADLGLSLSLVEKSLRSAEAFLEARVRRGRRLTVSARPGHPDHLMRRHHEPQL